MEWIEQEIPSIDVVNVNVVAVRPAGWPRLIKPEPIAAVLEARTPLNNHRTIDNEHVLVTEVGAETVVRNAAVVPAGALPLLFLLSWFFLLCLFFLLLPRLVLL